MFWLCCRWRCLRIMGMVLLPYLTYLNWAMVATWWHSNHSVWLLLVPCMIWSLRSIVCKVKGEEKMKLLSAEPDVILTYLPENSVYSSLAKVICLHAGKKIVCSVGDVRMASSVAEAGSYKFIKTPLREALKMFRSIVNMSFLKTAIDNEMAEQAFPSFCFRYD